MQERPRVSVCIPVYNGERYYWTKDREFEQFLDLPRRRPVPFELAAGVDDETARRRVASM